MSARSDALINVTTDRGYPAVVAWRHVKYMYQVAEGKDKFVTIVFDTDNWICTQNTAQQILEQVPRE